MIENRRGEWFPYKPTPKRRPRLSRYVKAKLKELRGYIVEAGLSIKKDSKPGVRYV